MIHSEYVVCYFVNRYSVVDISSLGILSYIPMNHSHVPAPASRVRTLLAANFTRVSARSVRRVVVRAHRWFVDERHRAELTRDSRSSRLQADRSMDARCTACTSLWYTACTSLPGVCHQTHSENSHTARHDTIRTPCQFQSTLVVSCCICKPKIKENKKYGHGDSKPTCLLLHRFNKHR